MATKFSKLLSFSCRTLPALCALAASFCITSCQRNSDEVWEDTKTAGRYVGRGLRSIGGKQGDSRQVRSRSDFGVATNYRDDFIPLQDETSDSSLAFGEQAVIPQPHHSPGDPDSPLPGISAFTDPEDDAELAAIFRNIRFAYNSSVVKGDTNLQAVTRIADYMKRNPNTYVFVEGHCDERGPQAYNLALGTRRSNAIRNLLIGQGVNLDNIFTISYGKERPLSLGHDEKAWETNRRGQFKVYQR